MIDWTQQLTVEQIEQLYRHAKGVARYCEELLGLPQTIFTRDELRQLDNDISPHPEKAAADRTHCG